MSKDHSAGTDFETVENKFQNYQSDGSPPVKRSYRDEKLVNKEDKICKVCGDKALGCNFDVISCESCKAFFRRNALKQKPAKCLFKGDCSIDVNTRRFCPFCRLKKCFDVGMKKDFILGENEKRKRMEKVLINRQKKMNKMNIPMVTESSISDPSNLLSFSKSVNMTPMEDTYTHMVPGFDTNQFRQLTQEENSMLGDLKEVFELSFCIDLEPVMHISKNMNPSLNQLINQSSITVLRIIKFSKKIPEFARLSQECQIGLLKGCWVHILLLRSISLYNMERDAWMTPKGDLPTNILKNATGYDKLHEQMVLFCRSVKNIIGDDISIIILIMIIVIFSPEGMHVLMRQHISNVQDKYMVLLKHHLEARYSYSRSSEMLSDLLFKIKEMKEMNKTHGNVFSDLNPGEIEPFMLEILDLK